jgi:hypothetical protein
VEPGRRGLWWHPEEIPENGENPGATRAVGLLLKQEHHSMPLVPVVIWEVNSRQC